MAPISRARRPRDDASSPDKPSPPNGLIPYSPPVSRASSDRLPVELLSDVLQRLPAKDLCRLRTVCRSWRSVISDKAFISEHAESHKEPLFLAKLRDDKEHVSVVDLAGKVVKQIATVADDGLQVQRTRLDLACLATEQNTCHVLNPATGGIQVLPQIPVEHPSGLHGVILHTFFALGLVASTRKEYKVLCCWRPFFCQPGFTGFDQQIFLVEVFTLTINGGPDHARWRPRPGPCVSIDTRSGVVVDGVVYFLTSAIYCVFGINVVAADCILSFDLASEEWRGDIHGPASTGNITSGEVLRSQLTLADLNGSLVLAHHPDRIMDLWFLLDFESRLWVKQYSIRTGSVTASLTTGYNLIPLLVLDDGRFVIHLAPIGLLFICDPGTNTFREVSMKHHLDSVGVFTGSLLSLKEGDMV